MSRTQTPSDDSDDETHSFSGSEDTYNTVLRVVEHNTGGKQPPLMSPTALYATASASAGLSGKEIGTAYRAAWKNDDLVKLRINGAIKIARRTDAALRDILIAEHEKAPAERNEQLMDAVRDLIRETADE